MNRAGVLIVEEDRFYVEFYREVLDREGYRVDVARSPAEALRRLREEPFDVVIADVVLKGGSGLELLAEIKVRHPAVDVIMVTSMQSIRRAVEALKMGAGDYLTKPVDRDELLLAIRKMLDRQATSKEHSRLISENVHFYELLRMEKRKMGFFSLRDAEKIQDAVLDALNGELGAPGSTLFIWEPTAGNYILAASRGIFEIAGEPHDLTFRTETLRRQMEEGRPLLESGDGKQWVPRSGDEGQRVILPLRDATGMMGAVRLLSRRGDRPYGPFDLELARHLLEAAALALRSALDARDLARQVLQGPVPGTYAPPYFRSSIDIQLSIARRYNRESALLLLSLENFEAISRQFKDAQVQGVVEQVCRTILEVIRETDLLTRLEAGVFGIFVPETDFYGAIMLKKRIKAKLTGATYPVDLKRDLVPRVQIGSAACPKDGSHYQNLLEAARRRMAEDRRSVFAGLSHEDGDFWDMLGRLAAPGTMETVRARGADEAGFQPIRLTEAGFQGLVKGILRDLSLFYSSRGLLYLGAGVVDPNSPVYLDSGPRENSRISIFTLGPKGDSPWGLPHITPVFISDKVLDEYRFALGITEHYSYAIACRRGARAVMEGFHTSDNLLVIELVNRLQERYLLQRRIG